MEPKVPLAEVAAIQNKVLQGGCAEQVKYSLKIEYDSFYIVLNLLISSLSGW